MLANFEVFAGLNRSNAMTLTIAICPMVSNAAELHVLVEFASERGARVFFNTVVFPASNSIKALSADRQREVLEQIRAGRREFRRSSVAVLGVIQRASTNSLSLDSLLSRMIGWYVVGAML